MATTTTNFGWDIPQSTDLVKDGATAIAALGQDIDTALVDLKGGTTGQILAKASATDLDYSWITNDVGDITSVGVTSPITGGGTSGAVTIAIQDATTAQKGAVQLENSTSSTSTTTAAVPASVKSAYDLADAAIAKSTVTTAGDIIYRNATVPARLGIGTAGQVLKVNSGATAPEWGTAGGGMTLISTTSISGTSTTVSFSPTSYKQIFITVLGTNAGTGYNLSLRLNGITSNDYKHLLNYFVTTNGTQAGTATSIPLSPNAVNAVNTGGANGWGIYLNFPNDTNYQSVQHAGYFYSDTGVNSLVSGNAVAVGVAAAITSISIVAGTSLTAGTIKVYGL